MDNNYTRIAVILDRSGSMGGLEEATITSFNSFVAEQKKQPGYAKLLLVQFDDQYETVFDAFLPEAPELTRATFVPRGMTALYDAQGKTINSLGKELAALPEEKRPSKVIVVTITDGAENSSKEFNREKIAKLIKDQQDKYSWDFVLLAANQDAVATGATLNINSNKSLSFGANVLDVHNATKSLNSYMSAYRSFDSAESAYAGSTFTPEDRKKAVENE